ncbi:MAG: beta-lactamase family protein [Oscillospiraceae bacterium]|nr:beta-lactamase family protein [Oscillospiraceae bacterium]
MKLTTASRTFQLLTRIMDVRTATEPLLPPAAEKPAIPLGDVRQPFPRSAPESQGVSSRHIQSFLEELARDRELYAQSVMILRNGHVLCEAACGSQNLRAAKYTFSACKSVVSLAIGLLADDGALSVEDEVASIFDESGSTNLHRRLKGMTVEDLLTMRSGVLFTEAEALTETDWVRRFLGDAMKSEPGAEFAYSSLNTYMLSAIVCRKTGKSLTEFLRERLFTPMGITDVHWETCPKGIEKGGWGLYIRPEDLAKLGQLVMDGGLWQGKRLLSREYIAAATTAHAVPPETTGDFNYGYQIWVGRHENTFLFNGMLGQNVLGFRDSGILVLSHAGADTDFQESRYFEIVSRYFGGTFPDRLPEDGDAQASLAGAVRSLSAYSREPEPIGPSAGPFLNRSFTVQDARAASVGLLPLTLQALYNDYTAGVTSVAVSTKGGLPELIYREKDGLYRLPVGLGRPVVTQLDFRGNVFHVAALGRFTHDEEERPVFYIRLDFIETPCVRIIKLVADGPRLLLRQTETPGVPYISGKLVQAAQSPLYRPLLLVAAGGTEEDYLRFKTRQVLSPELACTGDGPHTAQ